MEISVIICTYNRCESLKSVLYNLIEQEGISNINYEVLIIDNNSTDNTKAISEEFSKKYPGLFRYFFEGKQGKTFALNKGIREAKGDVLAFTDDDVIIDKGWIASIIKAFDENKNCNAFGGRVNAILPNNLKIPKWIVKEGPYKNIGGPLVEHNNGESIKSYHKKGMYAPTGANMFFHKIIFEKYGYFKEFLNERVKNIPMAEDTEYCFRLLRNKEEILYIPDAIVYHPVYIERLSKKYFRNYSFRIGRASVLMNEPNKNGRKLLGVPYYIYRFLLNNLMKYAISIFSFDFKKIFFYELKLMYNLGTFYENFIQNKYGK